MRFSWKAQTVPQKQPDTPSPVDPLFTFRAKRSSCTVIEGEETRERCGNPIEILKELLAPHRIPREPFLPAFYGGAIGLFSYDMKNYFEKLPDEADDDMDIPDCFIALIRFN